VPVATAPAPVPAGRRTAALCLSTWFGAGLLPGAPGTWGALAALPFAAALASLGGPPLLLAAAAVVCALGCWASRVHMAATDTHDPGEIVIDEVFGQWLTLALVPVNPWAYLLGFVLFRTVDILKLWPCNWIDRRVGGAAGVMLDDLVAAVYAGLALHALLWTLAR
jgi:phosphatidylglycerophosphatase A